MKRKIFVAGSIILGWAQCGLFAQQGIVSTGGDATGGGSQVSYSVGQIDYNNVIGTDGNIIEGVQQPFEIFVTSVETNDIEFSSSAFPNPSVGNVSLKIENFADYQDQELTYQLYDEVGKVLLNKRIEGSETTVGLESFSTAKYFLVVYNEKKKLKTYKIEKIY